MAGPAEPGVVVTGVAGATAPPAPTATPAPPEVTAGPATGGMVGVTATAAAAGWLGPVLGFVSTTVPTGRVTAAVVPGAGVMPAATPATAGVTAATLLLPPPPPLGGSSLRSPPLLSASTRPPIKALVSLTAATLGAL